jgi:hypothetical protein
MEGSGAYRSAPDPKKRREGSPSRGAAGHHRKGAAGAEGDRESRAGEAEQRRQEEGNFALLGIGGAFEAYAG